MKKLSTILLMVVSLFITVFVFLNSFEIVFNKNIPLVNAIRDISLAPVASNYRIERDISGNTFSANRYGTPLIVRISDKYRMQLVPISVSGGRYLARASAGQIGTIFTRDGTENLFVYSYQNLRTVSDADAVVKGDNIGIDSNTDWRYLFRVEKIEHVLPSDNVVIAEDGQSKLIICLKNDKKGDYSLITAKYITTEKVSR